MAKKAKSHERFLRITAGVYDSEAFRTLPGGALKLWLDVRTQFFGDNNGRLVITLSRLARRGWNSNSKLRRARDELIARGLIRCTKYCGRNVFHRASMYAFTDLDIARNDEQGVAGGAPSREYLAWTAAICAHPQKVSNGTLKRCDTTPAEGERPTETAPAEGERKISRKPTPILVLRPKYARAARSPAEGDISSSTRYGAKNDATVSASGAE